MKDDRLLDLDVQLLLLRYGQRRVLSALAGAIELSPDQIEQQLRGLLERRTVKQTKGAPLSAVEVATSEFGDRAEIIGPLKSLALSFENRTFLPNLRDVQQYLDRKGASPRKLKSRAAAGPILIRALSKLPLDELVSLAERSESAGDSDYALLSRAIMGKPQAKESDDEPQ